MTRAQKLKLIYRHTHRDYKGMSGGFRCILINQPLIGTVSVPLETLTDDEIAERLLHALKQEAKRQQPTNED